jgi:GGDEF domain-containing protein
VTTAIALAVAAVALAATALLVARARRRARRATRRRTVALERLAATMARAADELDDAVARADSRSWATIVVEPSSAAPLDPATGLRGRSGFVDGLRRAVDEARADDSRLALALIAIGGSGTALDAAVGRIAEAARSSAPSAEVFRAGERALALLLPATGRAEALAVIARTEAAVRDAPPVAARAVELAPGEDAIAFLARLLADDDAR